jgi:hypothetical protein
MEFVLCVPLLLLISRSGKVKRGDRLLTNSALHSVRSSNRYIVTAIARLEHNTDAERDKYRPIAHR